MAREKRSSEAERFERGAEDLQAGGKRAAQFWVENQAKAFEYVDEAARRWLHRRQDALDATRQVFEEMRQTENVGELLRLQQEWAMGEMRRLATDLAEFGQMTLELADNVTSRMRRATESTAGYIEQAGQEFATRSRAHSEAAD